MNSRRERLNILMKQSFNNLSFKDQLDLISCKYYEKLSITYEEFVLLSLCEEVEFFHEGKVYQIDYGNLNKTSIFVKIYNGKQEVSSYSEEFSSIIELLENFRIDGKRIRDIWDDVSF